MSDLKKRRMSKGTIIRLLTGIIPGIFFLLIVIPIVWMIISSFKQTNEIFTKIWALPEKWLFHNYVEAWNTGISNFSGICGKSA